MTHFYKISVLMKNVNNFDKLRFCKKKLLGKILVRRYNKYSRIQKFNPIAEILS